MQATRRDGPKPRPRPGYKGKPGPKEISVQNAKYIDGLTIIDRSKGISVPKKGPNVQRFLPSLLTGIQKCRQCYETYPLCKPACPETRFVSEVDCYWTEASGYMNLSFPTVRKCEDIAMKECQRLGMSAVVLRSDNHNTAAEFTFTGRRTGRHLPADYHITLYFGERANCLLLQGHCYTYVGSNKKAPQVKLKEGNRTILEGHEQRENLTLEQAKPEVYWGMNASCGWINANGEPVNADGTPIVKVDEEQVVEQLDALSLETVDEASTVE